MLASLLATASAAQPVGTLFHTAQERAALERQRASLSGVDEPLRELAVTGYVKRSDGKSTVFLDGRAYRLDGRAEQRLLQPRLMAQSRPPASEPSTPKP
jgi:hypothetical protein